MKQEKREYGYRSNAYIDGNTVRKEEIVPERTMEKEYMSQKDK